MFKERSASTSQYWNNWRDKQLEFVLIKLYKKNLKMNKSLLNSKLVWEGVKKQVTIGSPQRNSSHK